MIVRKIRLAVISGVTYVETMSQNNDERVELRVPVEDLERWRATAAVGNLTVSEWIRQRCNEVAVDQETIDLVKQRLAEREAVRTRVRVPSGATPPPLQNVSFGRDHLVELLREGWSSDKPLAHNWQRDAFPGKAVSIHAWADARAINWGGPQGYPFRKLRGSSAGAPTLASARFRSLVASGASCSPYQRSRTRRRFRPRPRLRKAAGFDFADRRRRHFVRLSAERGGAGSA